MTSYSSSAPYPVSVNPSLAYSSGSASPHAASPLHAHTPTNMQHNTLQLAQQQQAYNQQAAASPHSSHPSSPSSSTHALSSSHAAYSPSHAHSTLTIPINNNNTNNNNSSNNTSQQSPFNQQSTSSTTSPSHPSSPTSSCSSLPSSLDAPIKQEVYECALSEETKKWRSHFQSIQAYADHQQALMKQAASHGTPPPPMSPLIHGLSKNLFVMGDTLGTGTFGRVRLVHYVPVDRNGNSTNGNPRYFALKMLKKSEIIRLKQVEHIKAEKAILNKINHPYIISLYSSFQDDVNLYMLMEYVIGGEMFSQLRKCGRFSNDTSRFYAAEIILALQYLHSKDIVYRDLKPENLLLDSSGHIKITDFGFAKSVTDRTFTLCGTPEYLAPEIIQSKGHGKAVDWWALGVLIFEMLAGYPPFYDENPFGIYQKILAGKIEFPKHFSESAKDLVSKLLTADRTKRFGCLKDGAEDIKRHRWFRGLDWFRVFTRAYKPPYIPPYKAPNDTSNFDKYPDSPRGAPTVQLSQKEKDLFIDF